MPGAEVVSVLAGGWSVNIHDLYRLPGIVIAVNDAAVRAPCVDYVVSMDRLWTEHRWPLLCRRPRPTYLRKSAVQNVDVTRHPMLNVFECDNESSLMIDRESIWEAACEKYGTSSYLAPSPTLNGTNSGMAGVNLAFQVAQRCGIKRVILFGFDMGRHPKTKARYWYPDYEWVTGKGTTDGKYREWSKQFAGIAAQFKAKGIEVFNASTDSAIPDFPKIDPRSALI